MSSSEMNFARSKSRARKRRDFTVRSKARISNGTVEGHAQRSLIKGDLSENLYRALSREATVGCDTETSGLNPLQDQIGTFQLYGPTVGAVVVQLQPDGKSSNLGRLLENPDVRKVFHHAPFDLRFILAHWRITPRNVACTKIASKLVARDVAPECHSLRFLLKELLSVEINKGERRSNWLADELSASQIAYACADVEHLVELFDVLYADLTNRGLAATYESCLAFLPTRTSLDLGGWPDVFLY
ncbi:ribonuclease D [Micromonospora sp. WMMD730]|uniref:ribonuclease D n=1 Tax=Micromonospora sp. WMMD730 TaxID=3404128 RepID=UPI003B927120